MNCEPSSLGERRLTAVSAYLLSVAVQKATAS